MGISEMLGNAYMRVEDAYYGVLDFFEEKGVRLPWTYNDFLETKGIPALPFTIAILAVLVGGIFYVSTSNAPQDVVFSIALKDDKGRSLEDVSIKITDSKGHVLDELTASDGQTIKLSGISPNEILTISATKQGFGSNNGTLLVGENKFRLSLAGSNDAVVGRLKLVDSETGTTITSAVVSADWPETNTPLSASPGSDGIVLLNVPLHAEISLVVRADNYEDLHDVITFSNGDVKIKELTPKASATQGNSVLLVKAIDKTTQLPLEDVHITIENAQSGEIISDVDVSSGSHSENLTKGLVVRVSVSKDGYTTYTSNTEFPGGKTLRNEDETILAPLAFGGTSLHVVTQSESSKQPLSGVDLTLLNSADEKIDSQQSNFSGEAEFSGLNETNAYTLLAYSANFFPARKIVDWSQLQTSESGKTLLLPLTPFVSGNAGTLTVFVSEKDGKAATQSVVSVFEKVNGAELPLIATRNVDAAGSFTVRLPVGMVIVVRAQKGDSVSAEKELTIATGLNKVVLTLEQTTDVMTFTLKKSDGKPFVGNVRVTTSSGNELFSGATTDGIIAFAVPAGETVTLTATDSAGGKFTKTFNVGTQKEMMIVVDGTLNAGNAPQIVYEGLFDASGNAVAGISATQDAFARFTVKWPTGTSAGGKGGLFVRVGSDTITSVDSQFAGVVGLNGDADSITYGRSWNPIPKPGKETKDRSTLGKAGSFNKWMEAIVKNPAGTQTFDVRIKAREGSPEGSVDLFYRAFLQTTNETIRTPNDTELGTTSFNATKSGLYAQSLSTTVSVYENLPVCQGKICAVLHFVDADNRTFNTGNFQALAGNMYALQLLVQTAKPVTGTATPSGEGLVPLGSVGGTGTTGGTTAGAGSATIKATTSNENPLFVFTKSEVGTFGALKDTGNKDTSLSFSLPGTATVNGASARIQFLAENEGQTTFNIQIISGNDSFSQTLPIEIVQPKHLSIDVPDFVESGEKITVRVLDDAGTPLTQALLTITDASGKFAGSMKGTNTTNKGEQGTYVIDKALDAGLYTLRVSVPGYANAEDGFAVGIKTPLKLDEKVTISIPQGQTRATQNVTITNTTKFPISEITGEIVTIGTFPDVFTLNVGTIPALAPNGKASLPITVTYSGDAASTETQIGNVQLKVHGTAALAFPVDASSSLNIVYSPKLDPSCLQFSKEKLSITLSADSQPYGNMYDGTTLNPNVNYYGTAQLPNVSTYNAQGYNAYGYNSAGAYQTSETKRVNVKAKNNCGETLNLVPGITQQNGGAVVDGLKIAAIDSSLQLANGQEKQVDFEVSNDLFRAGMNGSFGFGFGFQGGAPLQYFATFSSAQLTASLPFEIRFSDRSRAIQTPQSVELSLIKTGSQKAVDQALVPITNIGASPIYDLRAAFGSGTGTSAAEQKVTFKLQGQTSTNTSGGGGQSILLPGQTKYPPLIVTGESVNDDSGLFSQKIVITGTIEGRRTTLKEIDVFARTGSSSCLEISAFDTPVGYISSETQGSISKRITVHNKCLEPVRVTGVESAKIGTNTFDVVAVDASETIEKDDEKEFNLVLTKSQAFKSQFTIQLKGLMVLSQKAIVSNPLSVLIALGAQELEFSQASNPVPVNVCEGGSITVRFPILAKKDECAQAYCDAEQAGHMLSDVIEKQLAKVVQQMQAKKNDASQFKECDITKKYCTFSQLGVNSPQVTLYLQNDSLTPNALSYVMKSGSYPRLGGLLVQAEPALKGDAGDAVFASRLGTGFGNAVYLPEIEGCGLYTLSIIGGVEVVTNQLQSDKLSVGVKLVKERTTTAECQDKIYNAANFLPRDRSLSSENAQQTRLGVVEYENTGLKEAAGWLAETVFGNSSRAVQNSSSNRMQLKIGNLAQSIVELTLDPTTKGEGTKNVITVVRQTGGSVQKEAMVEAGKIITSLGKNVNGCITRDEQTWRIVSIKDVGQFTYEGCPLSSASEGGLVIRSALTCCTLSTRSDVLSDVAYSLTPNGSEGIPGVSQLDLYEMGVPPSATNTYAKPGAKISYDGAYPLGFDTKSQIYGKDVLLCGTADPRTQQQANKQTLQTFATRTLDDTKAGPLKLELRTCTMDADDALAKAYQKGNGTWYATLDWDSSDARKTILQTIAEATQKDKLGDAYVSYQGQGILANDNPVYQAKFKQKKVAALGSFALNCSLACGACQGVATVLTLGASLPAMAWDCITACGAGTLGGAYELYKDDADGIPVLEDARDLTEATYGNVRDFATDQLPGSKENEVGAGAMFAGTTASVTRAVMKPLAPAEKGVLSGVSKLNYVEPGALVKSSDLDFLRTTSAAITEKMNANNQAYLDWASKFNQKHVANTYDAAGNVISTTESFIPRVPTPGDSSVALAKVKTFDAEITQIERGFDSLIAKYSGKPGFDAAAYTTKKATMLAEVRNLKTNTDAAIAAISTQAPVIPNPSLFEDVAVRNARLAESGIADATKLKVPPKFYQTKAVKTTAKFARSLVCGGVGNVAGFASYKDELSKEVENKITLDAGSQNIIDAQTQQLIFEKGQTYKFTVTPAEGTGKSSGISIDIVTPTTQVNPTAWLDDCAAK